jgi:hypothetical protein
MPENRLDHPFSVHVERAVPDVLVEIRIERLVGELGVWFRC